MSFLRLASLKAWSWRERYCLFCFEIVGVSIGPPAFAPWQEVQAGRRRGGAPAPGRVAALDEAHDVLVDDLRGRRIEREAVREGEMRCDRLDLPVLEALRQ